MYRRRRIWPLVALAIAAAVAMTTAFPTERGVAATLTDDPVEPVFPRPGGGPRVIAGLTGGFDDLGPRSYLLDPGTGRYHRVPYEHAVLSPDRRLVAVATTDGRVGVAGRRALLRAGEAALRWTGLPSGIPNWSPDGRALLVNTLDKGDGPPGTFAAHRYDLRSGRIRSTPIEGFTCENCLVGWAADSTRYVVMLRGPDPARPEGPAQYVNPDGSPGPLVGVVGHIWDADAYSPSRRYVIVEPSRPAPAGAQPTILDLRTGATAVVADTPWPLIGWYDERRVVRAVPEPADGSTVLEVVDIHTGAVSRRVPAPGLPPHRIQVGTSRGLPGHASGLGF